jgi:hypothetical protein
MWPQNAAHVDVYTADQMRAYALAAVEAVLAAEGKDAVLDDLERAEIKLMGAGTNIYVTEALHFLRAGIAALQAGGRGEG